MIHQLEVNYQRFYCRWLSIWVTECVWIVLLIGEYTNHSVIIYLFIVLCLYHFRAPNAINPYSGYTNWKYRPFPITNLLDGLSFPAFSIHSLYLYNGSELIQEDGMNFLYLPFIDFPCLNKQPEVSIPLKKFTDIIGLPKELLTK